MTVQGTLGSMLQGVSQQPARIRVPGQVTEQVNMYSDVAVGLTSRPATETMQILSGATNDLRFQDITLNQRDFIFGYKNRLLRAWDEQGNVVTVNNNTDRYLGTDMRFSVFEDTIYCTNRDTIVGTSSTVVGRPFHVVLVTALGGNFARTYKLDITLQDNTVLSVSYDTPDGDATGDAEDSTATKIIEQLSTALSESTLPEGMTVSHSADVLVVKYTQSMKAVVDDGDAGTILRVMTDNVEDQTDLPRFAPHGTVVKVVGDEAEEDDYYLRFAVADETVEGNGFGVTGVWEEWYDVTQPNSFDTSTMPHVVTWDGTEFTVGPGDWKDRRVGDEDSNPFPSFVGNKIRDIGGFESRLVFVAGPNVVMSRTNEPTDYFRKSATVVVDSDPIDMTSTVDRGLTLDWIVPFDRDLILISDPGDSQFVVQGGGITPKNASLVLTTSYEMFGLVRPATTGRTLLFPFKSGIYTGLKEFFTNDSVATNGADTLTEVQNRYIVGTANKLASSKNFNLVLVGTDSTDYSDTLWVYKYLWDSTQRLQSSWSKWVFPYPVLYTYFDNSEIRILFDAPDGVLLCKTDLNRVDDPEGWHVTLDLKDKRTVTSGLIEVPNDDYVVVQSTRCLKPGLEITPTATLTEPTRYRLPHDVCPDGSTVYIGQKVRCSVKPTMPNLKDRQGAVISSAKIMLQKFLVHLDNSSDVLCRMLTPYRDTIEYYPRRFPLDDDPLDPGGLLIKDYTLEVPWGEYADNSELELVSTDVRPTTILEVEWQGQVTGTRRRV